MFGRLSDRSTSEFRLTALRLAIILAGIDGIRSVQDAPMKLECRLILLVGVVTPVVFGIIMVSAPPRERETADPTVYTARLPETGNHERGVSFGPAFPPERTDTSEATENETAVKNEVRSGANPAGSSEPPPRRPLD
jgi:hypothetical protein